MKGPVQSKKYQGLRGVLHLYESFTFLLVTNRQTNRLCAVLS